MKKFQEYKFFAEWIQNLTDRRQATSQTYLTVNTAIFTVLAFLFKDAGFESWGLVLVSLPLFLAGVLACLIWHKAITDYKQIINWHYGQLREMEARLPDSSQIFGKEWESFYKPRDGDKHLSFSQLEVWLPRAFFGLYTIYAAGLVLAATFKWL